MRNASFGFVVAGVCAVSGASAQVSFRVTVAEPLNFPVELDDSGRLVVSLISAASERLFERAEPADAPFFSDPQPMFSMPLADITTIEGRELAEFEASFPCDLKNLPAGTYKAQAVFDRVRRNSSWRKEAFNGYSEVVEFTYDGPGTGPLVVPIVISQVKELENTPMMEGVEWAGYKVEYDGENGRFRDWMRAKVILPKDHVAAKRYPAVYVIPGFGGDHDSANFYKRMLDAGRMGEGWQTLHENAFIVVLDPESGNGHHLFANSANNGAVTDAFVHEYIPIIESRFGMIPEAGARVVTGHSSGGWASLWLGLERPDTFGAVFASGPDPVDFRYFQQVNIYEDESMYADALGRERASSTRDGEVTMTIREENLMEEVLGPRNTSGQQWDSWLAVFGPKGADGNPAALYDPETGTLDHAVAEQFKKYDIVEKVRTNPETYGPVFAERVRLIVGEEDTYDLDLAVASLLDNLKRLGYDVNADDKPGYITIVPGADHGGVTRTEAGRAFAGEMVEYLKAGGYIEE